MQHTEYHREIMRFLTEDYGIPGHAIDLDHSGNGHPRLTFHYDGVERHVTLNNSAKNDPNILLYKKRDITHDLGPPPIQPKTEKRRLDDMLPSWPAKLRELVESPPVVVNPPVQEPDTALEELAASSVDGKAAHYRDKRMRFFVPIDFARPLMGRGLGVTREGKDLWQITPLSDPTRGPQLRAVGPLNQHASIGWPCRDLTDLEPFGASPAKCVMVDGHILVQVDLSNLVPLLDNAPPGSRRRVAAMTPPPPPIVDAQPEPANTEDQGSLLHVLGAEIVPAAPLDPEVPIVPPPSAPLPHLDFPPTPDEMRACLALIRRIEEMTDRRLIKRADTGAWVFKADLIE